MATPHVTGLAALLRSVNPSLTADETRSILTQTAYDLGGAGFDESYGFGRADASAAVARAKDFDSDGSPLPLDCDDRDAAISPLKSEVCGNGIDDDCDGSADEGCTPPSSSSAPASSVSSVSSTSSASSSSAISSASSVSSVSSVSSASSVSSFRSSSSSSRSAANTCEDARKEFGELVRHYDQMRNYWGRYQRCLFKETEELWQKMERFKTRDPSCSFALPEPIRQCDREVICAAMRPLFDNLVRDYNRWRCITSSSARNAEEKLMERVKEQIGNVLEMYPQCGFSLDESPDCPSPDDQDRDENKDDHEEREADTRNLWEEVIDTIRLIVQEASTSMDQHPHGNGPGRGKLLHIEGIRSDEAATVRAIFEELLKSQKQLRPTISRTTSQRNPGTSIDFLQNEHPDDEEP